MATPPAVSNPVIRALAWLLDLAAQRAGYTVRGQPGWAGADEIEQGVRGWGTGEMMRAHAKRGRVLEYDARAPGETRPRWLYRISRKGAEELARTLGVGSPGVADPEEAAETRVLLRDSTQHVITGLQAALDPDVKPAREWIPGEPGWRSSRDLTLQMAREDGASGVDSDRWFTTEDIRWLVRLGFVEERVVDRTHIYRLRPSGAALRALEWRKPRG